ncbi:unnamed protein product [Spodoptera exigua]|nr:unnamed protein product [Spodoptera exigua]
MVRLSVLISFLFLVACVCAFPGTKFALIKNSDFGVGTAVAGSQSNGVVNTNSGVEVPVNAGDDTEIAVVDNVNTGAAFAFAGSSATGVRNTNNYFSPY